MVRRIGIIVLETYVYDVLREQLRAVFGGLVNTVCWSAEAGQAPLSGLDLVVSSTEKLLDMARQKRAFAQGTPSLVVSRTISPQYVPCLERVLLLPPGSKIAICSNMLDASNDIIRSLREFGISHIDMIPYYPGLAIDPRVFSAALTFGYKHIVPQGAEQIDLGVRVMDNSSIIRIVQRLGIRTDIHLESNEYIRAITSVAGKLASRTISERRLNRQLNTILEYAGDGILLLDTGYGITHCNSVAQAVLGGNKREAIAPGGNLKSVSPGLHRALGGGGNKQGRDVIIKIDGADYLVERQDLNASEGGGHVVILRKIRDIQRMEMQTRTHLHQKNFTAKYHFAHILTADPEMARVKELAQRVAKTSYNIAIYGESGTGKELFAQAIHNVSGRSGGPFVPVNVMALQDNLIESELFGYEGGAFTGARKEGKQGVFELAHNGTLFLDEIGDLSMPLQAKLLRALQEREIVRVGGTRIIPVNIRLITATNRNLLQLVEEGLFRGDLYYRINVISLHLPPLRERPGDVFLLCGQFLGENGISLDALPGEVLEEMAGYPWAGNVRELVNFCTFAACVMEFGASAPDTVSQIMRYFRGGEPLPATGKPGGVPLDGEQLDVLRCMAEMDRERMLPTKKRICDRLRDRRQISMYRLTRILGELDGMGLVRIGKTRQGTAITRDGKALLEAEAE